MIDDPAIMANILLALFTGLFLVIGWLGIRLCVEILVRRRKQRHEPEPETHGDDGGRPAPLYDGTPCRPDTPAPEKGSGLLAGDEPELPVFLKRTPGDQAALHEKYARRAGDMPTKSKPIV